MDTLGVVETRSIAAGALLADGMVKAARVDLLRAAPICSGRYLIQVAGEREAVGEAVGFAERSASALAGSFVISNVAPQVLEILKKGSQAGQGTALGVVECRTVAAGIAALDRAVKQATVQPARFTAGQGINGKSYFVLSGDIASVAEAVEAARTALGRNLIEAVVIPGPDAAVARVLTGTTR